MCFEIAFGRCQIFNCCFRNFIIAFMRLCILSMTTRTKNLTACVLPKSIYYLFALLLSFFCVLLCKFHEHMLSSILQFCGFKFDVSALILVFTFCTLLLNSSWSLYGKKEVDFFMKVFDVIKTIDTIQDATQSFTWIC